MVSQQVPWFILSRFYTCIFNLAANMILFPVSHSCQLHTTLLNLLTILPTILKRRRPIHDSLNHATLQLNLVFMRPSWSLYISFDTEVSLLFCLVLSHVRFFATPWTAARQASLSFTISWSLLRLMSIESVMPFNYLIFCHPPLLLLSIFPALGSFPVSWSILAFY